MNRYFFVCIAALFWSASAVAQVIGGNSTFEFLRLPPSAQVAALGGIQTAAVASHYTQAAAWFQNPALLAHSPQRNALAFHWTPFVADIHYGNINYAHRSDSLHATIGGGVQYISYGEFTATETNGQINGTFKGQEVCVALSAAKQWREHWNIGINIKTIFSGIESYNANGVAADVGVAYRDSSGRFVVALLAKNVGTQIKTYNGTHEPLPLDISLGMAKRLKHVPFSFFLTAHHLQQWDIRYNDPNAADNNAIINEDSGDTQKSYFGDKLLRHFVAGGELHLGKNLSVRLGYNHLRKKELKLANVRSLNGFTMGVGIGVRRFRLDYAFVRYHQAAASNHLSLAFPLGAW